MKRLVLEWESVLTTENSIWVEELGLALIHEASIYQVYFNMVA